MQVAPTSESSVTLDMEWQRKVREYRVQRRRAALLGFGITIIYTAIWMFSGLAVGLRHLMNGLTGNDWLRLAGFGAIFFGSLWLLKLPLAYRLNVLMRKSYPDQAKGREWLTDALKVSLVNGLVVGVAVEIVYSGLRDYSGRWWAEGGAYIICAAIPLLYAGLFRMFLFYDFTAGQDEQLSGQLAQFGRQNRVEVGKVYTLPTDGKMAGYAMAMTDRRDSKPSMVINEAMAARFRADEIETAMAHEIGHHVHHDGRWGTWINLLVIIASLYLALAGLALLMPFFGIKAIGDIAALPLFALMLSTSGAVMRPISTAFSRWRERRADEYAIKVTGKPDAFANSMVKFANDSWVEANPDWLTTLTLTHPPYSERIAMAERYAAEQETQDGQWRLT